MPRQRSPNRDKAFEIYKENGGNIENRQIAKTLNISEKTVSGWKCKDHWQDRLNGVLQTKGKDNMEYSKRKKGGQPKNKNSKGHVRSISKGNKNAETHGFFSKIFPPETIDIVEDIMVKDPLDMLWENIIIQYTAIARSQKIMNVKDQEDLTKVLKREKESSGDTSDSWEKEYELQFAWDKQATFLQAQSRAMSELRSLIKQYDEMLHNNWDNATEEQKLRIEKFKIDIDINNSNSNKQNALADAVLKKMSKRNGAEDG